MTSPFKFTFIIGYRHRLDRIQNLRRVLDWVNGFAGVEIILVEQDRHKRIDELNLKVTKHIFTQTEKPYNRSWAFNVGAKYATTDVLVFSDTDLIMNPQHFIDGLNALTEYDCVSPYSKVIDLDPNETNTGLQNILTIDRPGRGETDNQKINIAGGLVIFRKDAFFKIGGYPEEFVGWGGEDDATAIKIKKFLKWTELKNPIYHLWHERVSPEQNSYMRNLQILNQVTSLDDNGLVRWIENSKQKMGLKNSH